MDLEENLHGRKKLLYSLAKNYRERKIVKELKQLQFTDKNNKLLTQHEEIGLWWKEYFDELVNVENDPKLGPEAGLESWSA